MSLRDRLAGIGVDLPPPGPDRGGRLATALLNVLPKDFWLSHDSHQTAVMAFARSVGLVVLPFGTDLNALLGVALSVKLAHEADNDAAQALATFYADLWTLLRSGGVPIPDEEFVTANDELHGTGWTVSRDGDRYTAEPSGGHDGLALGWDDLYLSDDGWKGPFEGERGGHYWLSPSGQKTYAEHHPGRQEAHSQSFPDYFNAVNGDREHPEGVSSVHAAHRSGVEAALAGGKQVHPLALAAHPDLHLQHHAASHAVQKPVQKPRAPQQAAETLSPESQAHVDSALQSLGGLYQAALDRPTDQAAVRQALTGLEGRTPQELKAIATGFGIAKPGRGGKDTLDAIRGKFREIDNARESIQV